MGEKSSLLFHHSLEKYANGKLQERNEVYDFFMAKTN